jgi:hypothetical protein
MSGAAHAGPPTARATNREENSMTNFTRLTLPALAFALASTALFAGGMARAADAAKPADAMKPATEAMKPANAMKPATDAMKPADPMAAQKMKDCTDKAAMESDSMKKDEATKACDAMAPAK